jgi:hypothetical protein
MGSAQGQLLAADMKEFIPRALDYFAASVQPSDIPPSFAQVYKEAGIPGCLDRVFNLTRPFIAQRFLDELDGLAAGSGLNLAPIRRYSMIGELAKMGCSMIGAWGPATANATNSTGLMQLRALDWNTDGPWNDFPVVLVRHPTEDGHAFATVGYPGDVGAISGYSSADVAISEKVWLHYKGAFSWWVNGASLSQCSCQRSKSMQCLTCFDYCLSLSTLELSYPPFIRLLDIILSVGDISSDYPLDYPLDYPIRQGRRTDHVRAPRHSAVRHGES